MNRATEMIDNIAWSGYSWILRPLAWGFYVFGFILLSSWIVEKASLLIN